MLLLSNVILHGLIFAVILTIYLLVIMRVFNPRIWAFSDYPKEITERVSPQTTREKRIAVALAIPFFIIGIGFPLVSTLILKRLYGGVIPLLDAFLNAFGVIMFGNFADYLILDWLIVGTITPNFVIIPGTEDLKDTEYKAFRAYHAKGHLKGLILLILVSLVIGIIVMFL